METESCLPGKYYDQQYLRDEGIHPGWNIIGSICKVKPARIRLIRNSPSEDGQADSFFRASSSFCSILRELGIIFWIFSP